MNAYPTIATLDHVITQLVQFAAHEYEAQEGHPDYARTQLEHASYLASCFLAQHTVEGQNGVGSDDPLFALRMEHALSYEGRLKLVRAMIADLGGVK